MWVSFNRGMVILASFLALIEAQIGVTSASGPAGNPFVEERMARSIVSVASCPRLDRVALSTETPNGDDVTHRIELWQVDPDGSFRRLQATRIELESPDAELGRLAFTADCERVGFEISGDRDADRLGILELATGKVVTSAPLPSPLHLFGLASAGNFLVASKGTLLRIDPDRGTVESSTSLDADFVLDLQPLSGGGDLILAEKDREVRLLRLQPDTRAAATVIHRIPGKTILGAKLALAGDNAWVALQKLDLKSGPSWIISLKDRSARPGPVASAVRSLAGSGFLTSVMGSDSGLFFYPAPDSPAMKLGASDLLGERLSLESAAELHGRVLVPFRNALTTGALLSISPVSGRARIVSSNFDWGTGGILTHHLEVPTREGKIEGYLLSPASGPSKGIVYFAHGGHCSARSMAVDYRNYLELPNARIPLLTRLGYSVFLASYPDASPSLPFETLSPARDRATCERNFAARSRSVTEALQWLAGNLHPERLFLWGHSYGAAIADQVETSPPAGIGLDGIISEAGPLNDASLGIHWHPELLKTGLPPLLIIQGTGDPTVSPDNSRELLAKALKAGIRVWSYFPPGEGHEISEPEHWEGYAGAVGDFLSGVVAP